jgi:hypothetical protein
MKKIFIKALCAFTYFIPFLTFGQTTVSIISAFTNAQAFTAVEPAPAGSGINNAIVYSASVSNFPSGGTYEWSVANGVIVGVTNLQNVNVNWNNTNNVGANIKSVTIRIKNSDGAIVAQNTRNITVKHIGTIGSISLSGTSVGNGGTTNFGCGATSISVSSTVPVTDPSSGIVYTWTLPSGWTTASTTTTTNTITVTSNASGGGNIGVSARRSDGTTTQTASITVNRPPLSTPTFSSFGTAQGVAATDRVLCGSTTFQVTGGNGTSYLWQTTGGVSASSTSSSAGVSASSDGTIKVFPVSACGTGTSFALINIKTGAPGTPSFTADGDGNTFVNMCAGNSKFLVANSDRANSFTFQLLNGSASLITNSGSNSATFSTFNTGTFRVQASATNCNGSGSNTKFINVINCSSAFRVGPNPASNTLTITYEDETPTELMPDNIKLLDSKMKEYYSKDVKSKIKNKEMSGYVIDMDVSKFPRGEYYLHITNSNHPDKDKKLEKLKVILQ